MHAYSFGLSYNTGVPLLDEEFDKADAPPVADHHAEAHVVWMNDRAWDDQLDEGEEVSL